MALKDIEFFGQIDRKKGEKDGAITSQYPAWMHQQAIDDLREDVARMEKEEKSILATGDTEVITKFQTTFTAAKKKLKLVEKSKPKLTAKDKDELAAIHKSLGNEIRDSMFTRTDMMHGTADAHEEASRMVDKRMDAKVVGLTPDLCANMNIRVDGGKISRNDAAKAFKMIGHAIGEATNIETLRRDRVRR